MPAMIKFPVRSWRPLLAALLLGGLLAGCASRDPVAMIPAEQVALARMDQAAKPGARAITVSEMLAKAGGAAVPAQTSAKDPAQVRATVSPSMPMATRNIRFRLAVDETAFAPLDLDRLRMACTLAGGQDAITNAELRLGSGRDFQAVARAQSLATTLVKQLPAECGVPASHLDPSLESGAGILVIPGRTT